MATNVQDICVGDTLPIDNRLNGYTPGQPRQQILDPVLDQQMAHPCLLGARKVEEQLKHSDHQIMAILEGNRTSRPVRGCCVLSRHWMAVSAGSSLRVGR